MKRYGWAVLAGLVAGANPHNPDLVISTPIIGIAAFLTTSLFWGLWMRPGKASARRGAWRGGLAVLTTYPLSYLLQAFLSLSRFGPPEGSGFSGLFYAAAVSLVLGIFSLLIVGAPSLLIGVVLGTLLGSLQRWVTKVS